MRVFSLILAVCTFILILAGGLVTSHEAGLAVPDWPLSYGQWMPPMVGNIFWEHGHRMIAATVGFLTIILAVWVQGGETRTWLKKLCWLALAVVILQGLLGGLTVRMMLPPAVSIFHACLAQAFLCLTAAIAYFLNSDGKAKALKPPADTPNAAAKLKRVLMLTTGLVFVQLILGAGVRHTGHGVIPHILVGFFVLIHIILVLVRVTRFFSAHTYLLRTATTLGLVVVIQIFLGMGSFIFTRMVERVGVEPSMVEVVFTAAHQTIGALILVFCVLMTLRAWRHE